MPRTHGRGPARRRRPPPRICGRRISRRGPARRRRPPPRICRRPAICPGPVNRRSPARGNSRSPASRRSPTAPLTAVPRVAVPRIAVPRIAVPRVAVPGIAVPGIGRVRPVLAPARTGTLRAGVTSRPAIGRLRFFAATTLAPGPLGRDCIRLGLRRPSPAQVREPLVVGIVAGATTALIPLMLVTAAAGSPWIRDGLRNRGPSALG